MFVKELHIFFGVKCHWLFLACPLIIDATTLQAFTSPGETVHADKDFI